jgi:hypothetical protein
VATSNESRPSREEYAVLRAAKVEAALEVLAEAVGAIHSGEDWRRFLELQSRLHAYSANNVLLIATQHALAYEEGRVSTPEPTYVAGFNTWKALGRSVGKGQHGYAILAPLRSAVRVATDGAGTSRVLGHDDQPGPGESVEGRTALRGFKVEHVFAAEQTVGEALPEPPLPGLLEGEAPRGLGVAVMGMVESRGYAVSTVANARAIQGANGQTSWATRSVVIREDMDDAAMVKTLIHEAAHVVLHEPPGRGSMLPRPIKEIEAESVAFVVAQVHGMPTDSYSFPYVAGWAGDAGAELVRSTAARVAQAAREIIAVSPAEHTDGGRAPGAQAVIAAANQRRAATPAPSPATPVPEPALVDAVGV